MVHMEHTVVINAPIDRVFAYVTDFSNTSKWHKNMKRVGLRSASPIRLGSTYDWIETFAGKTMDLSGEITSWDPPHCFTWRPLDGPYPMTGGWSFATDGIATTVTRHSDTELSGLLRFVSMLMSRMARRQVSQELDELKRLIETSS